MAENVFDMSLDEIIEMRRDNGTLETSDVLDLGMDEDIDMNDADFDRQTTTSMMSYGRYKDPETSVNIRLRPKNFVPRPFGMPPLETRETTRQMKELEQLKDSDKLETLSNTGGFRSNMNRSMASFGLSRPSSRHSSVAFSHNNRHNPMMRGGAGSVKMGHVRRDLRQMLQQTIEPLKKQVSNNSGRSGQSVNLTSPGTNNNMTMTEGSIAELLKDQTLKEFITIINDNFGNKYNMEIQKEIATVQNKPFVYACGTTKIITDDGSGVGNEKLKVFGGKSSMNMRFSRL